MSTDSKSMDSEIVTLLHQVVKRLLEVEKRVAAQEAALNSLFDRLGEEEVLVGLLDSALRKTQNLFWRIRMHLAAVFGAAK